MKFAIFWAGMGNRPEVKEFDTEREAAIWAVGQDKPLSYLVPMEHALGKQLAEVLWGAHNAWIALIRANLNREANDLMNYVEAARPVLAAAYGDCTPWQSFRPEMRK